MNVLSVFTAAISVVACGSALAQGDSYSRVAADARVGVRSVINGCSGKIIESFSENGNAHGGGSALSLMCVTSASTAAWVLLSSSGCYDSSDREPSYCAKGLALGIPQFDGPSSARPPFTYHYNLIKYGLGHDCTVVSQPMTLYPGSGRVFQSRHWSCNRLDFYNGTIDAHQSPLPPRAFKTIPVETIGQFERASIRDENGSGSGFTVNYPGTFIPDRAYYNYDYKPDE